MKQQTSQITLKTDVGNVSLLLPIISQITYKEGGALADIYDEEIVLFYDSEMVYQCDKIWLK